MANTKMFFPRPIPSGSAGFPSPGAGEASGEAMGTTSDTYISDSIRKVCLQSYTASHMRVIFDVMPVVSVNSQASYESMTPVHAPGSFQVYEKSPSLTFSVSEVKLVSRTPQEAWRNLKYLNILKSWRMPFFGQNAYPQYMGAPPEVLLFSAYSIGGNSRRGNINNVPVVMTQLDYTYPNDCVYIPTANNGDDISNTPFPTIMTLNIALSETFSASDIEKFNLKDYHEGTMIKVR